MSPIDIATQYYHALYSGDYAAVRELAVPEMVFEDPSAPPEFNLPAELHDLESFLSFMQANLQAEAEVNIKQSYVSNHRVVLQLEMRGRIPGARVGLGQGMVAYRTEGVSILQVRDQRVVRHTDYIDYPGLAKSFALIPEEH